MKSFAPPVRSRFAPALKSVPAAPIPDADPIYQPGDTVMHPSEGVCTIEEIRPMQFRGSETRRYYILKPATEKSSSTVYLPVARGNEVLRRLLSEADIRTIISSSIDYAGLWIADSKQRKETFSRILQEGNYAKIIRMIYEIRLESARRARDGKKPCAADEAIQAEAERLLHQEFSYVLHLSIEDTVAFVIRELGIA